MNRETFIDGNKIILNTDFYLYLLSCENENTNLKQEINEIKEYALKEKEFNDSQIEEYKTCIETNLNGKFNDEEKENMEQSMTVKNRIYKLKNENQQLKEQLQQRDEVIEECIESIQNFMTHIDDGFCADMMTFIDILNKYKGDKNGN